MAKVKAHLNLITYALAQGYTVDVDGGGDDLDARRATGYAEIKSHVEAVDASNIIIRDARGQRMGSALIVLDYDQAPDEIIADYSCSPFMEQWAAQYY